jgi:hypothetical protein
MRKLAPLAIVIMLASARPASAEVGLGLFIGQPTGIDLKVGLSPRSALDFVFGFYSGWNDARGIDDGAYGHVTYLLQPFIAHGSSVMVPFRIGIGGAIYDHSGRFDDHLHLAVRVPFQVGIQWRRTPLEIYFEIALKGTVLATDDHDHNFLDLDGGIGIRFYF